MNKARVGIAGTGWRAEFYQRVIAACPDQFELAGTAYHSAESREKAEKWGAPVFSDPMELVKKTAPDLVVVSVSRKSGMARRIVSDIAMSGTAVLMETPPADTLEELTDFYKECGGAPIQVAEQYHLQPMTAARLAIAESGQLGEVYQSHLNLPNGYHSASVHRKFLNVGMELPLVWAKKYTHTRMACPTRAGDPSEERFIEVPQTVYHLDFGDKQAFNDLEGDQVRCWFRNDHTHIRGTRGEITDQDVYYMADYKTPAHYVLDRLVTGIGTNLEGGYLRGVRGQNGFVYENPFKPARLFDDEIAVATAMLKTAEFAAGGKGFYDLREAMQDTYLGLLTEEAAASFKVVRAEKQIWM